MKSLNLDKVRSFLPLFILILFNLFFFKDFFLHGKIPIPADAIVGMYHPWRDYFAKDYPNGYPYKNFLITDPARQQYPWRRLVIESLKNKEFPLWNPYNFLGTPLLANFQSAAFYPLNLLFFLTSFDNAWGVLVFLQPLLAGVFMYLYLNHLKLNPWASFLGAISFSYSGFFVSWLEWNTILHCILWLPLLLLAIEKITLLVKDQSRKPIAKVFFWVFVFVFSLLCSFLAGHPQTFFYLSLLIFIYLGRKIWSLRFEKKTLQKTVLIFSLCYLGFFILSSWEWRLGFDFWKLSSREYDIPLAQRLKESWFLPPKHLVQFLAPDFFGNPVTGNYWGEWNYGEFTGYCGIVSLFLAIYAFFSFKNGGTLFWGLLATFAFLMALPTLPGKIPYIFKIPIISGMQPSRVIVLIDFSLAILASFGLDYFLKGGEKSRKKFKPTLIIFILILGGVLIFGLFGSKFLPVLGNNLQVAKRNLVLPTFVFSFSAITLFLYGKSRRPFAKTLFLGLLLVIALFDFWRFGQKFNPFVDKKLINPETKIIKYLKEETKKYPWRFLAVDYVPDQKRVFPANTNVVYGLLSPEGYDPLFLKRYGELVGISEWGFTDLPRLSFNRSVILNNFDSRLINLFGVKYLITINPIFSPNLKLIFEEEKSILYENKNVFLRAFLVYDYQVIKEKKELAKKLLDPDIDLGEIALLEEDLGINLPRSGKGNVSIISYGPQKIVIETETDKPAILILTDNFYPGWQAEIDDGKENIKIFVVDYSFRGVMVPTGKHRIEFSLSL